MISAPLDGGGGGMVRLPIQIPIRRYAPATTAPVTVPAAHGGVNDPWVNVPAENVDAPRVLPAPFPSGDPTRRGTGNTPVNTGTGSTGTGGGSTGGVSTGGATPNTGGAALAGDGPTIAALLSMLGGGYQSPLDAANSPSTAALEALQPTQAATSTNTTSNAALVAVVLGAAAIGGVYLYQRNKKKHAAQTAPAAEK
jgi:hypothetical protein